MDREQRTFSGLETALLVLFASPVIGILILALIVFCVSVYSQVVPAATAETFVPELKASVRLDLYYRLNDEDSGQYLVVDGPNGRIADKIGSIMDWVHWSRTSLYLTEDRKIAVLGTAYADYIVDPSSRTINVLAGQVASERWRYLGAFEGGLRLRFIPMSEQRECNATATDDEPHSWAARPLSRQGRCQSSELAP